MIRRPRHGARAAWALAAALLLVLPAGCSSNSRVDGGFYFTSPGGSSDISYAKAERGRVGELSGPNLNGDGTVALADFAGKVVVVNFWAEWCTPCINESDDLAVAHEVLPAADVTFLGLDVRDRAEVARDFVASSGLTYPMISDPRMRTGLAFPGLPLAALPATVLLDRDHRVARVLLRAVGAQELTEAVELLLAEGA